MIIGRKITLKVLNPRYLAGDKGGTDPLRSPLTTGRQRIFDKKYYICRMKSILIKKCLVAAACIACVLAVLLCRRPVMEESGLWHTGDITIDSLLELSDRVDEVGDCAYPAVDSIMQVVERLALERNDSALAFWTKGEIARIMEKFHEAEQCYRKAATHIGSSEHSYLLARIRLGLSRSLPDDSLERKAELLYEALPDFSDRGDSLRVMQSLFDINMIYGYVWDDNMQAACLEEARRYVPDSLTVLRALMQANVLGLKRSGTDTVSYLHTLDSLRCERSMTEAVPPLGLMVNTDIYRLRGDRIALDSAAQYARITEEGSPGHPALWLYRTYRLRYYIDTGQRDSARVYASMLDRQLEEETPYAEEMVRELLHYNEWTGDTAGTARLQLTLRSLEEARGAYARGRNMALSSIDPRLAGFISRNAEQHKSWGWMIWIAAIVAVAMVVVVLWLLWRNRSRKGSVGVNTDLQVQLEDANRSLAAQQIRVIHKENVIQSLLDKLENGSISDDAASRSEIVSTLRNAVNGDVEWERFTTLFTQVRPEFSRNLTAAYPMLTQGELRLSCLLSIGLDNKQIARLLSIQPDSVKKARQRLRAHLSIPTGQTFDSFFSKF